MLPVSKNARLLMPVIIFSWNKVHLTKNLSTSKARWKQYDELKDMAMSLLLSY